MFITEWNELKNAVAPYLFDEVCIKHTPITFEIKQPIECIPGQWCGERLLKWEDCDYDIGKELVLTVGPFSSLKSVQAEVCIQQIIKVLEEVHYEYVSSSTDENTLVSEIMGRIVFKRTPEVDAHVRDFREEK